MDFKFEDMPQVVLDRHPGWLELYRKAWELAAAHIMDDPGMPAARHMDEGFASGRIWIWDTCFMSFYCKYAPQVFPGIESLDNFYLPMLDGAPSSCLIHHPDNPPLLAWAEHEYWKFTGDASRLRRNLVEKRYLQRHHQFLESLKTGDLFPFGGIQTNLCRLPKGYMWSGCASGMDNTPRGEDHSHNILWLDAISQQALSALLISRMAEAAGDPKTRREFQLVHEELAELVNKHYFNEADGSYYDIYICNDTPCKVLTPASFWPLLAEIATPERAKRQCATLRNPELLGGLVPLPSVARNSPYFEPDGRYWRGGAWLPTTYMTARALLNYGELDLAAEVAEKTIEHMWRTYTTYSPATIWEAYSPTEPKPCAKKLPNTVCRQDFCGWSALGPISMLIENVLGFHQADAQGRRLKHHRRPIGRHGVRNFRFGDIVCDVIADGATLEVKTNRPFTLEVDGKDYHCEAGGNTFTP